MVVASLILEVALLLLMLVDKYWIMIMARMVQGAAASIVFAGG